MTRRNSNGDVLPAAVFDDRSYDERQIASPPREPQPFSLYYEDESCTIYHGDCRDVLPTLEKVDHVITDPPYAPRAMKNARNNGETMKQRRDGVVRDFGYAALDDVLRYEAARLVAALVRRWAMFWCDLESFHLWRSDAEDAGLRYVRGGVWTRVNGAPQFTGDRPAQGVEACVIAHAAGQRLRWNGGGRPAAWVGPIVGSQDASREHTSPKPEWLMERVVGDFTDPGDTILDPFMGSGTTLVAAKRLGRRAIGIEREEKYCAVAAERLRQGALTEMFR
jgi:DNA modification methylase